MCLPLPSVAPALPAADRLLKAWLKLESAGLGMDQAETYCNIRIGFS